jgi:hypothetical protein
MNDQNKHLTPVWLIYVDGKRLDVEHVGTLKLITKNDSLNGISTFSVYFNTSDVKILDKGLISLDSEISIHLGYKDDVDEVFSGDVLGFKALFPKFGTEELEISGCNVLHRLAHGFHNRGFEEKTPSEVLKGLIETYSLKSEIDDFGTAQAFTAVDGKTDFDFILKTAGIYGKDVFAASDTVYVGSEISVRTDEIIFEWGKNLINFEAEKNIKGLVSGFDFIGWDYLKNESFISHAALSDVPVKIGGSNDWTSISKGGDGKFIGSKISLVQKDADDAKQAAVGLLQKNSFLFGSAQGSAEGNYKLRPGMRVTIKAVGAAFEGEYIADMVIHRFDYKQGYITDFILKRNMTS